jgi:hypothetical protein
MQEGQPRSVMEGRGAYNAHSALQASGAALALPLWEQAAAEASIPDGDYPIVIADYGASQGRNSVIPIQLAIDRLRSRLGPRRAISVAHTDLPANDFSSLFATVDGEQTGYVRDDPNVFPHAVGRSFFRQTLPDAHVSLGWSSYAAHWLSGIPGPVPGHIIGFRSTGALREAFFEQGRRDWESFLKLRCAEVRPGGRLVISMPSLNERGEHPGAVVVDAANDVIGEMVSDGLLTMRERERMCVAAYPRTPAETLAPFSGGAAFGLRLLESSFTPLEDGGWAKYREDGDAEALATSRARIFRVTLGPSLENGLEASADETTRRTFMDRLEAGMRRRLKTDPAPIANIVAILSLEKVSP